MARYLLASLRTSTLRHTFNQKSIICFKLPSDVAAGDGLRLSNKYVLSVDGNCIVNMQEGSVAAQDG